MIPRDLTPAGAGSDRGTPDGLDRRAGGERGEDDVRESSLASWQA